jgi:hypothetical protein
VEGAGLEEMLRRLASGSSDAFEGDSARNLKTLGDQVFETMSDGLSSENGRRAAFFEFLRQQEEGIESIEGPREAVRAYLRVLTFASVFNCEWYVISPSKG